MTAPPPAPPPVEPDPSVVFAGRLRFASAIALAALPLFAAADLWTDGRSTRWVLLNKLAQLLIVAWTYRAAGRATSWARVKTIGLVFVAGLIVTACTAALIRGDLLAMPLMLVVAVITPAVMAPWGIRYQVTLVAVATVAAVITLMLGYGLPAATPMPALALAVAFVTSLYAAAESERHERSRVSAEIARRESESRFRVLAETAPVLIWMTDNTGACTYLNPEWERLLGRTVAASDVEALWDAVHPDDRESVRRHMEEATAARAAWEVEYRIRARDGRWRWLLTRGIPRRAPGGRFLGYVGSAIDITARREEVDLASAARNAALEAARLKSDFLATLSHEIRTPMHGIFGMTELALDTTDEAERRSFLERARSCAETLMSLLDDILDFSRIEAGRLELTEMELDVRQVLREAVDMLSVAAAHKGLRLEASVEEGVPPTVVGDPTRLRQVLVNLLGNAVKFTEEGQVAVTARAAPNPKSPGTVLLTLTVRDTGIGIPRDRLGTIFDAFTQVDASVSRKYGGTGLGLAITRRLVDLMGGTIDVESVEGMGSTFTVVVPLAVASDAAAPRTQHGAH